MTSKIFKLLALFTVAFALSFQSAVFAGANDVDMVGGGEFFRSGSPNSTIGMDVSFNKKNNRAKGHISLHTSDRSATLGSHFDTEFDVSCVKIVSQDADVLEVLLSGIKTPGSQTSYLDRTTSDNFQYSSSSPIVTSGDKILGRLRINNASGLVERSDWTTGQELCVGTGPASLNVGSQLLAEFLSCENPANFLSISVPDCDDPSIGSLFPTDRELRLPNTIEWQ